MSGGLLVEVHRAADEAERKIEPLSYRVGRRLVITQQESARQLNRFRYPVAIFVMAGILILILASKDAQHNLKVVVGSLIFLGIVWSLLTTLNFVENDQVPESAEAVELDMESEQ